VGGAVLASLLCKLGRGSGVAALRWASATAAARRIRALQGKHTRLSRTPTHLLSQLLHQRFSDQSGADQADATDAASHAPGA